jgi:hypothetical protein
MRFVEAMGVTPGVRMESALRTKLEAALRKHESSGGGKPSRPGYPIEFYETVATIYAVAFEEGRPAPTRAVAEVMPGATYAAAAKWVSTCRRKALLPATTPGIARASPNRRGK